MDIRLKCEICNSILVIIEYLVDYSRRLGVGDVVTVESVFSITSLDKTRNILQIVVETGDGTTVIGEGKSRGRVTIHCCFLQRSVPVYRENIPL